MLFNLHNSHIVRTFSNEPVTPLNDAQLGGYFFAR